MQSVRLVESSAKIAGKKTTLRGQDSAKESQGDLQDQIEEEEVKAHEEEGETKEEDEVEAMDHPENQMGEATKGIRGKPYGSRKTGSTRGRR